MKRYAALVCLVSLIVFASVSGRAQMPTPSFTLAAGNITMPSSGNGLIPFTLTSVNGFVGSVHVGCTTPDAPAGVTEPVCDGEPVSPPTVLAANATATGVVGLCACKYIAPTASSRLNRSGPGAGASWALAGALMLGFGLQRKRAHRYGRLLLAVGMLIGLAGVSACGGGVLTLTPGTYTYTISATEANNPSSSVTTKATVTVPRGIVVQTGPF